LNRKGLSPVVAALILFAVAVAVSLAVAVWMRSLTYGFMDNPYKFDDTADNPGSNPGNSTAHNSTVPSGDLHIVEVSRWVLDDEKGWYVGLENYGEEPWFVEEVGVAYYANMDGYGYYGDTVVWNGVLEITGVHTLQIEYGWGEPPLVDSLWVPSHYQITVEYTNGESTFHVRHLAD